MIPNTDRFSPWALTITVGDTVRWTNLNSDYHSIVSIEGVNTLFESTYEVIAPNETLEITFETSGLWAYYCAFHAHLDTYNQPSAPGCGYDGDIPSGITSDYQCTNRQVVGNYGTPMMGVISILPVSETENPDDESGTTDMETSETETTEEPTDIPETETTEGTTDIPETEATEEATNEETATA